MSWVCLHKIPAGLSFKGPEHRVIILFRQQLSHHCIAVMMSRSFPAQTGIWYQVVGRGCVGLDISIFIFGLVSQWFIMSNAGTSDGRILHSAPQPWLGRLLG